MAARASVDGGTATATDDVDDVDDDATAANGDDDLTFDGAPDGAVVSVVDAVDDM